MYQRSLFTTPQKALDSLWSQSTFGRSHRGRETSDRVMAAGWRLRDEAHEQSTHACDQVAFQLHTRLQDMALWVAEFTRKSEEVEGQIDRVRDSVIRLQRAIDTIPPILGVDSDIFKMRQARMGIDQIVDEPQKALESEVSVLLGVQEQLRQLVLEGQEVLRLLRKLGYSLGKQLKDRRQAVEIDYTALNLNAHSSLVALEEGPTSRSQGTVAKPEKNPFHALENEADWEILSGKQVTAAEKILKDADGFLIMVESVLQASCERIQNSVCGSNAAFEARLIGLRRVKDQLEEEHAQISINIRNMEDTLDKLRKGVVEKQAAIALAESRLQLRRQRPNYELVKDQVQRGLELELICLQDAIQLLHGQLQVTARALRSLLSNQLRLEDEINIKIQSIAIDETNVLPLRKTITVQPF